MDPRTESFVLNEINTVKTHIRKIETLIVASRESDEKSDNKITDWKGYLTKTADMRK